MAEQCWMVISCDHDGCTATERVQVDHKRPPPAVVPLWKSIGWRQTETGDYCPEHRVVHRASRGAQ